jgi:hypothetical protein
MSPEKTKIDLIANWRHDTPPGTSFKSGTYAPTGGHESKYFCRFRTREELGVVTER